MDVYATPPKSGLCPRSKGRNPAAKSDEFLENYKRLLTPPPHFWKIMLHFFLMDMVAFMQGGIGQIVAVNMS